MKLIKRLYKVNQTTENSYSYLMFTNGCSFPGGSVGKGAACNAGDLGSIPGWEDPLENSMVTHSSILAWRIPWTEEPGRLHTVHGVARVGNDLATKEREVSSASFRQNIHSQDHR